MNAPVPSVGAGSRALVYGLGITGTAVAEALVRRGAAVVLVDDRADDTRLRVAERLGTELIVAPDPGDLDSLVRSADVVCPAPGVAETHPLIGAAEAAGVAVVGELDLAYEWEHDRAGGPRPMLAITGTDGKTTTTLAATAMLRAAGRRAVAVGNIEVPLVAELDGDAEVFVVECSSFRLNWLRSFRAEASVWLNVSPDHLDWHASVDAYVAAKARLWAHLRSTDVAVGNAADAHVLRHLHAAAGRHRTFGTSNADYRLEGTALWGPQGRLAEVADLRRGLPHDITNALAAAAIVLESGFADVAAVSAALAAFDHPPHRIQLVGEADGVRWFNDSKATTPHAARTAIRGFERVVLLAGGRNKGLDLTELAAEHERIVAVVALGEAAAGVEEVFAGRCPVQRASSMAEAVALAGDVAEPGDVVLLSPACASFDWYPDGGYPARGNDFARLVGELLSSPSPVAPGRTAQTGAR